MLDYQKNLINYHLWKMFLVGLISSAITIVFLSFFQTSFDYLPTFKSLLILNSAVLVLLMLFSFIKNKDILAPQVVFSIFLWVSFMFTHDLANTFPYRYINKGLFVIALGICAFAIGALIGDRLFFSQKQKTISSGLFLFRLKKITKIMLILPITAILFSFIKFGGIPLFSGNPQLARFMILGSVGNYVSIFFILLIPAAIFLTVLYRMGGVARGRYWLIVSAVLLLYLCLGFRSRITYCLLGIVITHYYWGRIFAKKRAPAVKSILKFILVGLLIVVLFGIVGYVRLKQNNELYYYLESDNLIAAIPILFTSYIRALLHTFVNVIMLVDREGLLWGWSYWGTLLQPLPGHYIPALDVYLVRIIYKDSSSVGGSPPTVFGESYINFGTAGVVAALFLIGLLLSYFYKQLITRRQVPLLILYAFLLQFFIGTGFSSGILIYYQYVFALIALLFALLYLKNPEN